KRKVLDMTALLNHTIIAALDRHESAAFYCHMLEASETESWGLFSNIMIGGGVMLQFAEPPFPIQMQHYAFLVCDDHFDRALMRLNDGGITYWADPQMSRPGQTNTDHGGRGVYFKDPAG